MMGIELRHMDVKRELPTSILLERGARHHSTARLSHFLEGHIKLDSDSDHAHGDLCGHLAPSQRVYGFWVAFKEALIAGAPGLAT